MSAVTEPAYAKLNLILHVGPPRRDGLHPLCSIFASIDLADEVRAEPSDGDEDSVHCPGVHGPNLATRALAAFRARVPGLPPVDVRIAKRIPVAAGLGGGSADAAAVLRAANRIAGDPLDVTALREIGATLGSDVPSQIEPRHALVQGVGEIVEPIELPALTAVLVPQPDGLSTAAVYAELDRMGAWREELDPELVRARAPDALENDLQPAALALRPELSQVLDTLHATGGSEPLVSGSGPTCFALFADSAAAERAGAALRGALLARLRDA